MLLAVLLAVAQLTAKCPAGGTERHPMFVGTNCGSNDYLEARVELGTEHNRYDISLDRTDVQKSVIQVKAESGRSTTINVAGVLERYTPWDQSLVLIFATPESELLVLDEDNSGKVVAVLDRKLQNCDLFRGSLICESSHRDSNGKLSTTVHLFKAAKSSSEEQFPKEQLPERLKRLISQ